MSAGKVAKVLVTGGNGFVGSAVCRAALSKGLHVISVNRSGRPNLKGDWVDKVVWVKADTLEKEQWSSHLEGVKGVVACVGGFGSNEVMKKICGSTNVAAAEAAKQGGVERFAFISAHDYKLPFLLSGYYEGKQMAEKTVKDLFGQNGASLRPGFIYGDRVVGDKVIKLGLIGKPLSAVTQLLPKSITTLPFISAALLPPVPVEAVANTAVGFVLGEVQPSNTEEMRFSVYDILKNA
uniref:NAD(P)-binding domain-containing protein n=1 Tax=Palpitomonas bilix TaxID=652834 RepID=A0A7S3GK06_9EUKA|mmetsp:Transcript_6780/g.17037  ORF Transcript_6780/g.17037 Transcript_6780/m.17037 type:complete len:237 (+) Transcript_6780:59-769(+)|eukprot:CAMPEP_0113879474 /NCGR_PEP_ID=MMETSP0780_2-20120614/7259_1 /TAXON_ID=652834 /ORGANISM="Palpitomonas bilix" /LENGTH=236 /DNA_ID=CAMNT_0000866061 /DNA_START=64 /DNA_END=774 /DNA_ORIENTATION=+ /assembly_acc=CAM_ASM_000599